MRRPGDRLVLVEKHAQGGRRAARQRGPGRLVSVLERDGYASLKAQLPPRENRGLVLIDPPYESDAEFDQVIAGLDLALERWPTGMFMVWYPLTQRAGPVRFHRDLKASGIRRVLDVNLSVLPDDAAVAMQGSGLVLVNPPWQLETRLRELLPPLHALLSPEGTGGTGEAVEWLVPGLRRPLPGVSGTFSVARRGEGLVSEATHEVIVDHARGLHVRVHDRRADELEAALLQVLAERIRLRRAWLGSPACPPGD